LFVVQINTGYSCHCLISVAGNAALARGCAARGLTRRETVPLNADLLDRKSTGFVLWQPRSGGGAPALVIGRFEAGNPPRLADERRLAMAEEPGLPGLFTISAQDCQLTEGTVYHYWFEVDDSGPGHPAGQRVRCTDPTAWSVDWRLRAPRLAAPYTAADRQPAALVKFSAGRLKVCDPAGEEIDLTGDPAPGTLPANAQLVIYEMPTAWSRISDPDDLDIGTGTFQDVRALVDPAAGGADSPISRSRPQVARI
jgi:pullulanase